MGHDTDLRHAALSFSRLKLLLSRLIGRWLNPFGCCDRNIDAGLSLFVLQYQKCINSLVTLKRFVTYRVRLSTLSLQKLIKVCNDDTMHIFQDLSYTGSQLVAVFIEPRFGLWRPMVSIGIN